MAVAARPKAKASGFPTAPDQPDSARREADLRSIADSLEAALEQVTFTAQEIEGVIALDAPSWQSISATSRARHS